LGLWQESDSKNGEHEVQIKSRGKQKAKRVEEQAKQRGTYSSHFQGSVSGLVIGVGN
jgi:hypothetical protein